MAVVSSLREKNSPDANPTFPPNSTYAPDGKPLAESVGAWWKVYGGFLVFTNIWGIPISYGVFQSFYTLQYLSGTSASAISWVGTIQVALLVATGLLSGPLYDLGYWRFLVLVGSFLTVFGMMMLSLATDYYQVLLAQGVCVGLGCGLLYVPTLTLAGNLFSKNRAIAMGIITSGVAFGGIVYTIIYLMLLPRIGFSWTVRVMAFVALAIFTASGPALVTGIPSTSGPTRSVFDRSALKDTHYVVFTSAQFFVFLGYLVPLFYIPTYSQVVLKTTESTSFYVLVGSQGASLLGRIGATLPVPYVGTMIPWTFCCAISGILCYTWIAVTSLEGFVVFSTLFGFFSGALIALPPGLFPKICPDQKTRGSRMGISWTATAIASLIGSPIAGAIVDLEAANLLGAQVWSGTVLLISAVLLLALWALLVRKHHTIFI